ncbi:MAG: ParA family protein [Selenomonadaceae bacterium]|nr:ParA family protein [Selenomonadaceae bacterium]
MGKTITIANQKGGVGKTTTAVNLAAALAEKGKRMLILDIDPQGNATSGFGIDKGKLETTIYDVLIREETIENATVHTDFKVDLVPANIALAGAEIELVSMLSREMRIKRAIAPIKENYDYIFIDCPPSLGLLTLNALTAADTVLIPIQCEFYALEGVTQLMNTIQLVKHNLNESLDVEGILMTMFDGRNNLSFEVIAEVKRNFGKLVYKTYIPRNVRLSEAPSYGKPIMMYDKNSKGADSYTELAKEMIRNGK